MTRRASAKNVSGVVTDLRTALQSDGTPVSAEFAAAGSLAFPGAAGAVAMAN
jgi:hypothetical protein